MKKLVLDNRGLAHAAVFVKGASGKRDASISNRHAAVSYPTTVTRFFAAAFDSSVDSSKYIVRLWCRLSCAVGDASLFLPGDDFVEAVALGQGPMRTVVAACRPSEAPIVASDGMANRLVQPVT